ncbi:efflux RND transporter periplasmic adaptor subunit [Brumimicrobium oceani]|uniref:RND efflux pump membrane fusion protein barrel-sandwich domain-containing protein n=1 Tax=Brumimicrobium oceani TaxID=2100725 RepID=A0A2U2X1B6_9FLAO|nr:efflux RND transporter periplasmic adaptor subunit [Brumimicrobium oceani]PWH81577.1 hypothetical protein DIT68_14720 [Brumimicrobium oceani]
MKAHQKLIIGLIFIIISLLIALLSFISSNSDNPESRTNPYNQDDFKLMEIKQVESITLRGIIIPEVKEEVHMKLSGKIDGANRPLSVGSKFKKNEILIKADRLDAIYNILAARAAYKTLIQKLILSIKTELPSEFSKWNEFENKIQKSLPLPELPILKSKKEELLIHEMNIVSEFYKTKAVEKRLDDYVYLAPFEGIIIESKIRPGSSFQANENLLTLAKIQSQQLITTVEISNLQRIRNNDTVAITNPNGQALGKALFLRTGRYLSDSSKIEIHFEVLPPNQNLYNQEIHIHYPGKPTFIPNTAIKQNTVKVLHNGNTYEVQVKTTKEMGDSSIVEGLPQNCMVIANNR